jgi:hypothetical protein
LMRASLSRWLRSLRLTPRCKVAMAVMLALDARPSGKVSTEHAHF